MVPHAGLPDPRPDNGLAIRGTKTRALTTLYFSFGLSHRLAMSEKLIYALMILMMAGTLVSASIRIAQALGWL